MNATVKLSDSVKNMDRSIKSRIGNDSPHRQLNSPATKFRLIRRDPKEDKLFGLGINFGLSARDGNPGRSPTDRRREQ